ncbi:leucine-rich repeat domain-containing protein [Candidatus Cardinium hertigii]|jgi:Leucine-rich repeat (LRR) protein|uniref:Leucine-rich repeat domain-containing protein n=1 Tax=Candidatus Cardinium hertigii TaxID=247481 RepID=A0A3N2QAS5_9BACT|nr:leucine-rich repeat domain-containing protein [Candidatus Cardinium hertigii]ROT46888.1 leucine-rich repeat domain-containing protein [Candidatus Cardinium hertigii]
MQNHSNLHKALHFLACSIVISCQEGKQHVNITDVSNELLCEIIGHLYDEEDMQSSRFVNRRFKNVTEDVVRERYKNAHKPYEINGSSQALFEQGLSYAKAFRIQHVRYCGPMDENRIRSLIRLVNLLNRNDRPLLSLHLLNQDRAPLGALDLNGLNVGDDALNAFLSVLSEDTKNNLRHLNLNHNQLTTITGLENLTQLRWLYLIGNRLRAITGLKKLTQLKYLNLGNNQLTDITELKNLTHLKSLYLNHNQLTAITGLENLTQLLELDISNNELTAIAGLKNLTQLKCLYLNHNQLTAIAGLENLTQLQKLYLNSNRLTDITGLEDLRQLEYLVLSYNRLTAIITGLENLTQLRWLYLTGNLINNKEIAELRNRGISVSY